MASPKFFPPPFYTTQYNKHICALTISVHQPRVNASSFWSADNGLFPLSCDSVITTVNPVVSLPKVMIYHHIHNYDLNYKSHYYTLTISYKNIAISGPLVIPLLPKLSTHEPQTTKNLLHLPELSLLKN